jgi:hypothetical protein
MCFSFCSITDIVCETKVYQPGFPLAAVAWFANVEMGQQ